MSQDKPASCPMMKGLTSIMTSILLPMSIALAGYFIARALHRNFDEVTVKGLAEREVKADLAVWTLEFVERGTDLAVIEQQTQAHQNGVIDFLKKNELESAIDHKDVNTVMIRNYHGTEMPTLPTYELTCIVTVKTTDVDKVKEASEKIPELLKQGIAATSRIDYKYTKFADLREAMLGESFKSARSAAHQFAENSKVRVGHIKAARQGSFTIIAADNTGEQGHDWQEGKSIKKLVRVVSTVTFHLKS